MPIACSTGRSVRSAIACSTTKGHIPMPVRLLHERGALAHSCQGPMQPHLHQADLGIRARLRPQAPRAAECGNEPYHSCAT